MSAILPWLIATFTNPYVLGPLLTAVVIPLGVKLWRALKPLSAEEKDRVLGIALPLIAAGKDLAQKTATPWDNLVVGVAEKIAQELAADGTVKPAAVPLVVKHLAPAGEVEAITADLVRQALKTGIKAQ